ncbi:hypothetical protein QR680_016659 [Steinernema hermaphroditum]|uniref:MARVEL domain-containing protein n=1 Tax=Steinernema hermaphroditum TaxID=289476 RepID=A0AA39LMX5_9BILA|nr:hypothetical protein QR680_016659 [Steinernema hermaphroditum]
MDSSSFAHYDSPPGWRHSAVFSAERRSPQSSQLPPLEGYPRLSPREAHIGVDSPLLEQPKRVELPPKKKRREVPHPEFWYLSTGVGVCRIIEALCALITFGLIVSVNALFTPTYIAEIALLVMFFTSLVLASVYSFNINRVTENVSWILFEMVYTCVAVYMSGVTALIMMYSAIRWQHNPWIFSVIFAFFTFFAFVVDFCSVMRAHRRDRSAKHSDVDRIRTDEDDMEMKQFERQ